MVDCVGVWLLSVCFLSVSLSLFLICPTCVHRYGTCQRVSDREKTIFISAFAFKGRIHGLANLCITVIAIYAPMIYAAQCIMFWMRAYPLRGQVGGGLGPGNQEFFGPCEMASSR